LRPPPRSTLFPYTTLFRSKQQIASSLTSWQTPNGPFNVEHLAGMSPNGDVLVFYWSPQHDWQVVNVSQIAGAKVASSLTSCQTRSEEHTSELQSLAYLVCR